MALLAQVSTQKLLTSNIQTASNLFIRDGFNAPGYLNLGGLTFETSSSVDIYVMANNFDLTGSISSLGLLHFDGNTSEMGSLLLSSIYLGNVGGTTAGQLTTDQNATDLFWKGSKLNGQTTTLVIPYSTLNTSSFYQLYASSTQLYFGTYGSTAQIYMGDVLSKIGNTSSTNPFIILDQAAATTAPITSSFSYTGSSQTFQVPQGITEINVSLNGAGGGGGNGNAQNGGAGGLVSGTLAVTPGESLTIVVGQAGQLTANTTSSTYGGGGGAGLQFFSVGFAGSGGGRTAIQRSGADIVVAGGGGGGGQGSGSPQAGSGGAGGGLVGANGGSFSPANVAGGGTQSAGGAAGGGGFGDAQAGSLGQGGRGNTSSYSGGGGGGYYGGGGGGDTLGGAGGSSYVANLTGTVVNTQGGGAAQNTNGSMTISYDAPFRPANILEVWNRLGNKILVGPNLNTGLNVRSINNSFILDVSGAARATTFSSVALNVSTINNGSLFTNSIYTSSILTSINNEPIKVASPMRIDVGLEGKGSIAMSGTITGRYDFVVSTLGSNDVYITSTELGKKLVFNTASGNNVYLPDASLVGSGFNFLLQNDRSSFGDLNVYTFESTYLFTITVGSAFPISTDGVTFYNF